MRVQVLITAAAMMGFAPAFAFAQGAEAKAERTFPESSFSELHRSDQGPVRTEQVCPPPEALETLPSSSWNNVELGLSFSLNSPDHKIKPYSRYTCRRQPSRED